MWHLHAVWYLNYAIQKLERRGTTFHCVGTTLCYGDRHQEIKFVEVRVAAGECRTFMASRYVSQTISKPPYFSSHIGATATWQCCGLDKSFQSHSWRHGRVSDAVQPYTSEFERGFTMQCKWKIRRLDWLRHDKIRAQWQFIPLCVISLRRRSSLTLFVLQSCLVSVVPSCAPRLLEP